jgi:hypothetical protein
LVPAFGGEEWEGSRLNVLLQIENCKL